MSQNIFRYNHIRKGLSKSASQSGMWGKKPPRVLVKNNTFWFSRSGMGAEILLFEDALRLCLGHWGTTR